MTLMNNWGFRMALLYGGFVALMLILAVIATHNPNDLVATNYYDQEIAYEGQMQKMRSANSLKEPLRWTVDRQKLVLQFPAAAAKGAITLYRASDASQDRVIAIAPDVNGHQEIDLSRVVKGSWRMKVAWEVGGISYYNEDDLFVE